MNCPNDGCIMSQDIDGNNSCELCGYEQGGRNTRTRLIIYDELEGISLGDETIEIMKKEEEKLEEFFWDMKTRLINTGGLHNYTKEQVKNIYNGPLGRIDDGSGEKINESRKINALK